MAKYIIAVDIGTTTLRACLYDRECKLVDSASEAVEVMRTDPVSRKSSNSSRKSKSSKASDCDVAVNGELLVEINPDKLFAQFCTVVRKMIDKVPGDESVSMGICCQRNSFVLWDKKTLDTVTNFVVWSDTRARKKCAEWNKSWTIHCLNFVGGILHKLTRKPRYKAAQMLKFLGAFVSLRLMVTVERDENLRELLNEGRLGFGCVETWLLWKLTHGKTVIAEHSNTSSTGTYDPFLGDYNRVILKLLGFHNELLIPLVQSATKEPLAVVSQDIFERPVHIHCLLADQQAALYGVGGLRQGDVKISLGTGTFVNLNTGRKPHASMNGMYPLVGWCLNGRNVYCAEGNDHDTAVLLNWAKSIGLFEDIATTSDMAYATTNPGVYFIPAFGGLQTPINDEDACCGFLGLRPHTKKAQMVRAILEAIAFRVYQIWMVINDEYNFTTTPRVRICGGVANNDFVCQTISSMLNVNVERVADGSMAATAGVALMAGMIQGWWSEGEIESKIHIERTFVPIMQEREDLMETFDKWKRAVKRCSKFYE